MGEIIPPTDLYKQAEVSTGERVASWFGIGQSPRPLEIMDDHILRDIGMTRTEVNHLRLLLHYPY